MKRRAFTLIELLMVILIIALLLTLLIPGISAALRAANRARCQGNLKSLGNAFHNYYSDHQAFPKRSAAPNPYTWDDDWFDQMLTKYIPNPNYMFCPANNHDMAPMDDRWSKSWSGEHRQMSYVILDGQPDPGGGALDPLNQSLGALDADNSWNLSDYQNNTQGFRGIQNVYSYVGSVYTPTIEYPIARPVWADGKNNPVMGDLVLEKSNAAWNSNHGTIDSEDPLGMNVLYGDGHAAWVAPDVPSSSATTRQTQRLWRRIWKGPDGYVRWLVAPKEVTLPDKHNPRS